MDHTQSGSDTEKKQYRGYDVNRAVAQSRNKKKPWFWKVLGLSLLITFLVLAIAVAFALHRKKQQTNYLSKLNDANSIDLLLEDNSNITITKAYHNLKNQDDYTLTRFLKESEKGNLFSYLKTEGLEEDYKEVLSGKNLYRFDGNFTYYYGFVADDFEKCVADIKDEVLQLEGSETVDEQTESTDIMKVTLNYNVQPGDLYTKIYGLETGTKVKKVLTVAKESLLVTSDVETVDDKEIYSYTVTFNGENKNPVFYRELKEKSTMRNCKIYYDYEGEYEEEHEYTIPVDTYFTLLEHEDYTTYMDQDCTTEFTTSQMQFQNPYTDLTLYMKKGE